MTNLHEQLMVYKSVHGYTRAAIVKAIEELEKSIKDNNNLPVIHHLISRKEQLKKILNKLESFED